MKIDKAITTHLSIITIKACFQQLNVFLLKKIILLRARQNIATIFLVAPPILQLYSDDRQI
jgi:hypothetical protein